MIPVNFVSTEFVDNSYDKLVDTGIGILGMKPLGGGRLEDIKLNMKFINQYESIVPVIGIQDKKELEEDLELINTTGSLDEDDKKRIKEIKAKMLELAEKAQQYQNQQQLPERPKEGYTQYFQ